MSVHALGAYAAPSQQNLQQSNTPSTALTVGVIVLGVGALAGLTWYGVDSYKRSKNELCFKDAAELMYHNAKTYSKSELGEELAAVLNQKYRDENVTGDLESHAKRNSAKLLKSGLPRDVMLRFLNRHVENVKALPDADKHGPLRSFGYSKTLNDDLKAQPIASGGLFPCADVKRFTVLYVTSRKDLDEAQSKLKKAKARIVAAKTSAEIADAQKELEEAEALNNRPGPAHYAAIVHDDGEWSIRSGKKRKTLIHGDANRIDATKALQKFAEKKYGRTNNLHFTVFRENEEHLSVRV
jgi:hypothetical protein